jgi:long-chain-fatty-acid---luciferin-component ligase
MTAKVKSRSRTPVLAAPVSGERATAQRAASRDELDELVFGEPATSIDAIVRGREQIAQTYAHHFDACAPFAEFVKRLAGPTPVIASDTLDSLPLLPIGAFKTSRLCSVSDAEERLSHTSSGTTGRKSTIIRDRDTMMRLVGSLERGIELLGHDWFPHEVRVVHLGAPHELAGELWFAYIMSLVELLYDCHSTTDLAAAQRHLETAVGKAAHVLLVGPPFLVRNLALQVIEAGGWLTAENLWVLTGGGWKDQEDEMLDQAVLADLLRRSFGVTADRVRDAFNQVELNTVFVECEAHHKHVPPWVRVTVRDPRTLACRSDDRLGLLAYMDASATSYPAFFIGDDLGLVDEGLCECGQPGQRVSVVRRVSMRHSRGCAAELASLIAEAS